MIRRLLFAGGIGLALAGLRCLLRGHHDPKRHPLGGFRCTECRRAGADLDDMGPMGQGYVAPVRRVFDRAHGEFTRTSAFEPTSRGRH